MKIWSENIAGMTLWFCKRAFICGCGFSVDEAHEAFVISAKKRLIRGEK